MQANVGSDQLLEDGHHVRAPHDAPKDGIDQVRLLDAAHSGIVWGVRRLQIVDIVVSGLAARTEDEPFDDFTDRGERVRFEDVLNDEPAFFAIPYDLAIGNHGEPLPKLEPVEIAPRPCDPGRVANSVVIATLQEIDAPLRSEEHTSE